MLILSRCVGERILIGDNITLTVVAIERGKVRLAVDAPKDVTVNREEVHLRLKRELESRSQGK